jgi:hypothetical protein
VNAGGRSDDEEDGAGRAPSSNFSPSLAHRLWSDDSARFELVPPVGYVPLGRDFLLRFLMSECCGASSIWALQLRAAGSIWADSSVWSVQGTGILSLSRAIGGRLWVLLRDFTDFARGLWRVRMI